MKMWTLSWFLTLDFYSVLIGDIYANQDNFFLNEIIAISMQLKNETWWLKLLNVHMEMSYSSYTKSCCAACSYYYCRNISSIKINTCYVLLMGNVNTMCAMHKNKFSLIKIKWMLRWPREA